MVKLLSLKKTLVTTRKYSSELNALPWKIGSPRNLFHFIQKFIERNKKGK